MKKIIIISLLLGLIFPSFNAFSQKSDGSQDDVLCARVLRKNIIGKQFVFGHWQPDGTPETRLVYLGKIKMRDGQIIKIMTLFRLWGLAKRGTRLLMIFSGDNKCIGDYYSICLSAMIKDGNLIFINRDYDCNAKTIVDLKDGLPEEMFIKCRGESGDLIPLEKGAAHLPVKILKFAH